MSTLALDMWIYAAYLRFKIHAIPHVLSPLLVQLFPNGALGTGAQEAAMVDFADSDKEKMRSRKGPRGFSRKKLIFRAKGPELFPSFSEVSASLVVDYYG